ncbi:MAG: CPBP family intramembrane glutamic endopeptidase [Gemmatimonadota bacterium]|nr:CPBP family intramembrane glutamic endopeptidase [Gemmatimonadota bacterium]
MTMVWFGMFVYPILVSFLILATPLTFVDAIFLGVLLELLPVLAVAQVQAGDGMAVNRTEIYLTSGFSILVLGLISLGLGLQTLGLERLGLGPHPRDITAEVLWTVTLVVAGILILLGFSLIRKRIGSLENRIIRDLMPVTSREKKFFVGLALCAGFGEEVAYRGYAVSALVMATGSPFFALLSTSAAFGVLHSYQGKLGVVRTSLVGLLMGVAFIHIGSLWPPMIAHALIDLVVGLALRDRLLS